MWKPFCRRKTNIGRHLGRHCRMPPPIPIAGSGLFTSTHYSRLVIAWVEMERCSNFWLRILIRVVYFKDRNWISKTVYCISCLVVCKIAFCSEFPNIPDNAGRKTRRIKTQAIAKRYAFHANAINILKIILHN